MYELNALLGISLRAWWAGRYYERNAKGNRTQNSNARAANGRKTNEDKTNERGIVLGNFPLFVGGRHGNHLRLYRLLVVRRCITAVDSLIE